MEEKEYINAPYRFNHPLHKEAMKIREANIKKRKRVLIYGDEETGNWQLVKES